MKTYQVRYRNTQGTFLRILTAVQRRGLDMPFVHAEKTGSGHLVILALQMNPKQAQQVCREWHAIVDVEEVCISDEIPNAPSIPVISQIVPRVATGAAATA